MALIVTKDGESKSQMEVTDIFVDLLSWLVVGSL